MERFEVVTTTAGVKSIRDNIAGEIMHNPLGPWREANELYVVQSELAKRLQENVTQELVIYDVGLGAAANALAAIDCIKKTGSVRPVRIISFEHDLKLGHYTLEQAEHFEHIATYQHALAALLQNKEWRDGNLQWTLIEGDFLQTVLNVGPKAHFIYFDPYSPTINQEMWTQKAFAKVKAQCHSDGAVLLTYSRATPVRVALLLNGFYVGHGLSTGKKEETTIAATKASLLRRPLGVEWLDRFKRSHTPIPFDAELDRTEDIRQQVAVLLTPQ
jgi:tRNA U34 5-methylaminomethyl-2-thiouridine-forming methyltransferase MnmC